MAAQPSQAREAQLQRLRLLCNGSGERRASERWSVDLPLEGWLQLEGDELPPIPVDLLDLSSGGLQVVLDGHYGVRVGQCGVLITQAHGGGCGYRQVRCCWEHPHPQHPQLHCLGLAFEVSC